MKKMDLQSLFISFFALSIAIFANNAWQQAVSFPQVTFCLWKTMVSQLSNCVTTEMCKWIALQKSKQLSGWNRRLDKIMRLTVIFMLYTKVSKLKKEDWLQIYD